MATVDELTTLREKLTGLRNDIIDKLCREMGAGELDLLCAITASLLAVDDRVDELRQTGDRP